MERRRWAPARRLSTSAASPRPASRRPRRWPSERNYAGSTSAPFSYTVNKGTSTTAIVSMLPASGVFGLTPVTLTAHVTGLAAGFTPTAGTLVTFKEGAAPLGTAVIDASGDA